MPLRVLRLLNQAVSDIVARIDREPSTVEKKTMLKS